MTCESVSEAHWGTWDDLLCLRFIVITWGWPGDIKFMNELYGRVLCGLSKVKYQCFNYGGVTYAGL